MANPGIERMMMLLSITERGSGRELIEYLDQRKIKLHCQCAGTGTAPSEMMDILGLGTRSKDIVISFATQGAMQNLAWELSNNLNAVSRGKGIMMILSPNAVSQVFAAMITRQTGEITPTGGEDNVKSEYKYSLICIAVNHGYTEQVMQTAKKAVVLNLENVDKALARRVVDFLSGYTYALDGSVKKISQATYLFCPYNMEVLGDLKNLQGEVESYV